MLRIKRWDIYHLDVNVKVTMKSQCIWAQAKQSIKRLSSFFMPRSLFNDFFSLLYSHHPESNQIRVAGNQANVNRRVEKLCGQFMVRL